LGVDGSAFFLRDGEQASSWTWCEYFAGHVEQLVLCAIIEFKKSYRTKPNSHYWIVNVGAITDFFDAIPRKVRVIHEPDPPNDAHVSIRNWPKDELDLLYRLAEEVNPIFWYCERDLDLTTEDCVRRI
jgi:hypothetical protein